MKKLKVLIIQELSKNLTQLEELLINCFANEIILVGTFCNFEFGFKSIIQFEPDLVFISMFNPDQNSIQQNKNIHSLSKAKIVGVFSNKHELNHITESCLFDNFVMPLKENDIKHLIYKIHDENKINDHTTADKKIDLNNQNNSMLLINRHDKTLFIEINSILRIEANGACTDIYYENKKVGSTKNFKYYENLLSTITFIKINRGCLLNINKISEIIKQDGNGIIIMKNGTKIEISKTKKDKFISRLLTLTKN